MREIDRDHSPMVSSTLARRSSDTLISPIQVRLVRSYGFNAHDGIGHMSM